MSTKYSSVRGISNIDFTPAEMTATGVLPSSVRSEDISIAEKEEVLDKIFEVLGLMFKQAHPCILHWHMA